MTEDEAKKYLLRRIATNDYYSCETGGASGKPRQVMYSFYIGNEDFGQELKRALQFTSLVTTNTRSVTGKHAGVGGRTHPPCYTFYHDIGDDKTDPTKW